MLAIPRVTDSHRRATGAAWLVRLRWVAATGQLATVGVVIGLLRIDAPAGPLLGLIATTAATNAAFHAWVRRRAASPHTIPAHVWNSVAGGLMLMDLLVLTAMLAFTGGPTNPFVVFYFVNLALCGVLLPPRWAWLLGGVSVVAFTAICWRHAPLAVLRDPDRLLSTIELGRPHVVTVGAAAAFAACGGVIVYFTTRLTREVARAEQARARAEELRAKGEKLEALGTLAAGAAHELATPLAAIAVAAGELSRTLPRENAGGEAAADVELIQQSLARCRRILDRMSGGSGQAAGEAPSQFTAGELLSDVLGELPAAPGVAVRWSGRPQTARMTTHRTAVAQALRAVVQNALDAGGDRPPRIDAGLERGSLRLVVRDTGVGMPGPVLARAGEPFFTTKPPGHGLGLGLYLARSVLERIGGTLRIDSVQGSGTTVVATLPLAPGSASAGAGPFAPEQAEHPIRNGPVQAPSGGGEATAETTP